MKLVWKISWTLMNDIIQETKKRKKKIVHAYLRMPLLRSKFQVWNFLIRTVQWLSNWINVEKNIHKLQAPTLCTEIWKWARNSCKILMCASIFSEMRSNKFKHLSPATAWIYNTNGYNLWICKRVNWPTFWQSCVCLCVTHFDIFIQYFFSNKVWKKWYLSICNNSIRRIYA